MKKLFLYLLPVLALVGLSSCGRNFLDVEPNGQLFESNYYKTPDQVFSALVAAYNPVGWEVAGTYCSPLTVNTGSDECMTGGGGQGDFGNFQAWTDYTLTGEVGPQGDYWSRGYTGIYRSNLFLQKIEGMDNLDPSTKKRYIAEAKFLRGYYYLWLVRLFKNIVLTTEPIPTDKIYEMKQADPKEVYAQIEKDFKAAIPDLPEAPLPTDEDGRATKGAARAFLAKSIMFEAGPDDNSRMGEVVDILEHINSQSSPYKLVKNYADLFKSENKFTSESVFEIPHTDQQKADWGDWPGFDGFVYSETVGPRGANDQDYLPGYGFNPVTQQLADDMQGDPRYDATILDMDKREAELGSSYEKGYDNTGFFIKKYAPMVKDKPSSGAAELNFFQDYVQVRLADTYLLEAEAIIRSGGDISKAAHYLNLVRERVGLSDINAPTLKDIYHERHMELATEGHRFYDLVRTGRIADKLASRGFKKGINEILPIPQGSLDNTQLEQNPGYQ